jgi:GH24 family phage-related lysozyme (muramidase)
MALSTTALTRIGNILKRSDVENNIPYMYKDSKNKVTAGVGFLLNNASDAKKLPFRKRSNKLKATPQEIENEFNEIKKYSCNNCSANAYKKKTSLYLTQQDINNELNKKIRSFEKEIIVVLPDYSKYPEDAQVAIFDIVYNVGITKFKTKWPTFLADVKKKDWKDAAKNSHRKISEARNAMTKKLLENCVAAAAK